MIKRALLLAALVAAPVAAQSNPAAKVSAGRLKGDVEKLVAFGTRHTLSVQDDPRRGIGAAVDWGLAEFKRIGAECGGCLEVLPVGEIVTGPRVPTPTRVRNAVAIQRGTERPDEVVIVQGHIDSRVSDVMDATSDAPGANDDGSGTALVMELARILSSPDVTTERSIRFILWNNEETGLNGARAYVDQRAKLQGQESPPGSGRYPEPKWLGMVQHDMMLFDHGMPRADGTVSPTQRPEADVNIEFQGGSKMAAESQVLAWTFSAANEKYALNYPATVGSHMTNTDSVPFQDLIPSISLRENERGAHIGNGWDPHWHQPTDMFSTFSDDDFRLGLNAAQTTLGAVSELAGVSLKK